MITRRFFALASVALLLAACGKSGERCATCGMKIDPSSAFRAEVVSGGETKAFDTPRCAITAFRKSGGTVRVQEFYSRAWVDASSVKLVLGSDVMGPMGQELVAVDAAKVEKFMHDHGGTRALSLAEVDDAVLSQ